ncbi:MAG: CBS domain-containing protein [Prolixibacteraceae bacterium]|nr:CBS domain-containing protein [Prolixibacteraceae bacterium]MBN2773558.1 CBS domain-containing protein [Prolixibacteraceae bacterium]
MEAKKLISDSVPSLKLSDKGQKALNWMDVFKITHLPVVNGEEYIGLVSDKIIYDLNLTDKTFDEHIGKLPTPHVHENQHVFEVASILYKLKLSVVPVVNSEHVYQGVITLYDLARKFSNLYSVHEPGGVILLEINMYDYSLSQIAQIVESNNAKILSLFVTREYGSKNVLLTIKLDIVELSPVIQTFIRYNYKVLAVYMDNSILNDLYEDRYDQFIKYMNI